MYFFEQQNTDINLGRLLQLNKVWFIWVMRCPFTSSVLLSCISTRDLRALRLVRDQTASICLSLFHLYTAQHTRSHIHSYTCSHSSPDIWWGSSGSCHCGAGTLTRTKDTSAVMTYPYWPDRAEKQEVGTRQCQRGHSSWESDLNTVE